MPSRLTIRVPEDYVLARDACSYGYFLLSPNHWSPRGQSLARVFDVLGLSAGVLIDQPGKSAAKTTRTKARAPAKATLNSAKRGTAKAARSDERKGSPRLPAFPVAEEVDLSRAGSPLRVVSERSLTTPARAELERQIRRMLWLDESAAEVAAFHALDPRWKASGRGRLFRSPTLFEDMLKTVTSCNVTWPGTVQMNRRLCEVCGRSGAFPTATRLSRTRTSMLRARCRVGYRDARIVELATMFRRGEINQRRLEDPATPDDEVRRTLLELPGIGPYAAANIMQLLGRYGHLPLDTESVRHGKTVMGLEGTSAQIMKKVREHFEPFGKHAFRSYWFELWQFYESRHGPAHTWERASTGTMFTAALLNKAAARDA
jgi:3-methyladenine DNA glycosylase/8-oxoguanine DNA glycosylase